MARRRFFVDEVRSGRARITGADAHHLTRVLRVERGQKYEISDNSNVYLAEIDTAHKDLVSFTVLEAIPAGRELPSVTVACALVRFERFEWMIEKATELGAAVIVPVAAARSEKGLERAAAKRMERWRKIAQEAAEQSRRDRLPVIEPPVTFDTALRVEAGVRLLLDEDPGAPPLITRLQAGATCAVLAGPEGGWTDRERAAAIAAGWNPVSLGPTVLKTETACVAALALINANRSAHD